MRTKQTVKFSLLFTLILAFVAITVVAIGGVMKKEKPAGEERAVVTETWYFQGGINDDPTNPNNYAATPPNGIPCDEVRELICQIEAPNQGGLPQMDAPIVGKPGETVASQILEVQEELEDEHGNPEPNDAVKEFRSQ